jgi:predicted ArsR family transcriptional regulator
MPSLRSSRRSGKMLATDGTKEVLLHGDAAAQARAQDRERLKERAILTLRRSDPASGVMASQIALRLNVDEPLAKALLAELIGTGLVRVAAAPHGPGYALTERGRSYKSRKEGGPNASCPGTQAR